MLTENEMLKLYKLYGDISFGNHRVNNEGRNVVSFKRKGKWSMRQVAAFRIEAKLGRKLINTETVDHIDGNKLNDDVDNLQVLSRRDNILKAHVDGTYTHNKNMFIEYLNSDENIESVSGDNNGMSKITNELVKYYRVQYENGNLSKVDIINKTGMSRRAVENFLNYRSYKNI